MIKKVIMAHVQISVFSGLNLQMLKGKMYKGTTMELQKKGTSAFISSNGRNKLTIVEFR